MAESTTTGSTTQSPRKNLYWLGKPDDPNSSQEYSRVTTCLALSQAVYATNADYCIRKLNNLKYMNHGITELIYSQYCPHQYLIAFKKSTKEIYVSFRGTDGWKAIYTDIRCYLIRNKFQGRFHSGFYRRSELIPLEPFIDLLNKNEDFKLIFTGHSLGAAIAATITARLLFDEQCTNLKSRIQCIAFGSPLICDNDCGKYINEHYQKHFHFYINRNDIVPILLTTLPKFAKDKLLKILTSIKSLFDRWKDKVVEDEMRFSSSDLNNTSSVNTDVSDCGSSIGFIDRCLNLISLDYTPFGQIFHTVYDESSTDNHRKYIVSLTEAELEKLCSTLYDSVNQDMNLDSLLTRYQNHSIENYVREIYEWVINTHKLTPGYDFPTEVELIKEFVSTSPLHHFFLPKKDLWTAYNREVRRSEYIWSLRRDIRERANEETITLQLQGPAVSLITHVKCEQSVYAQNPAKPDEILSETSLSVFNLTLPLRRNPTVDQYPFFLTTHFGVVNLKGSFNPKYFVSSIGLEGRKRQIADLSIIDLYKLAFSYSTFTGPVLAEHANESVDVKRRRAVKEYLLLCEELFQERFEEIEKLIKNPNSQVVEKIRKEIAYFQQEYIERQNLFSESHDTTQTDSEQTSTISTSFKLIKLQEVMDEWQNKNSNNNDSALATTEVIKNIIPTLVAIMFSTTTREYDFVLTDAITTGGITAGCSASASLLSAYIFMEIREFFITVPGRAFTFAAMAAIYGGFTILSIRNIIYDLIRVTRKEYMNILKLLVQTIGSPMDEIKEHPYYLEKSISEFYNKTFKRNDSFDYISSRWEHYFKCDPFKNALGTKARRCCFNLIKLIDAHYQLRQLLSEDFAVGVVGSGKTGKSKLIQELFNFDTKSGKERTVDMHSYRVSDNFRIVDFPHLTSTKDLLRSSFLYHHTLVNAVIVVLDARKLGDESEEKDLIKTVKSLANEGVDILYCFNRTDEMIKECKDDKVKSGRVNRFERAEREPNQVDSNEQSVREQYTTSWTKEELQKKLETFATNYDINVRDCIFTFFELDIPNKDQWDRTHDKLINLGVKTPKYIKKDWLRNVLDSNSVSPPSSIEKVMNFWCKQ